MNGIGAIALLVGNVVALYLIYRVAKWAVRKVWPKKKPATPQREPIIIGGYRLENPDEAAAGADAVWTLVGTPESIETVAARERAIQVAQTHR
jgi:3-hydroxyisobutyrate dehydrogenase-like beta-hydroxyacid dehydrogenase